MANKVGLLNGILLILLNFFAVIPLGIFFDGGLSSVTSIPLELINYNNITAYSWGIVNGLGESYWWLVLENGLIPFICTQLMILIACVISIISAYTKSQNGRKGLIVALIMILVPIVYIIIDALVLGGLVAIIIPSAEILGAFRMGFYILILCVVLGIISIKVHPNTVSE